MTRDMQQIAFTAAILIVVSAAVWQAEQWAIKAKLFPWVIGIPLIAMLLALLVQQIIHVVRTAPARAERGVVEQFETVASAQAAAARRRGFAIVGWLLGFLGALWLIGFPAGGTLGTLAYLRFAAREKWPISLAITLGTADFFWAMITFLNTPFPRGTLLEALDLELTWFSPLMTVLVYLQVAVLGLWALFALLRSLVRLVRGQDYRSPEKVEAGASAPASEGAAHRPTSGY